MRCAAMVRGVPRMNVVWARGVSMTLESRIAVDSSLLIND